MKLRTILLSVALIWCVALGIVWLARGSASTPEKVESFVSKIDWENLSGSGRERALNRVIEDVIRLDSEQRQQLRESGVMRDFYLGLSEKEQIVFLERTLPSGFRQMMEALNEMPRERRQRLVRQALRRIEESGSLDWPVEAREETARVIIEQGLKSYFNESSAETKLDLAPLIEEIQRVVRMGR